MPFKDLEKQRKAVRDCNARRRLRPEVKDAESAYAAERWQTDEGYRRVRKNRNVLRSYGITLEQYEASIVAQGNRCAICHKEFTETPCLDHSHTTGQLRKFLCHPCNRGLGQFGDDPNLLEAAALYLREYEGKWNHENV